LSEDITDEKYTKTLELQNKSIFSPKKNIVINDPKTILMLNNAKKRVTLELLLNQEKTIMQLSKETGWNPGTIKRHVSDLYKGNLITVSRIKYNEHRTKSTFYRATAKKFIFRYEWP